MTTINGRTPEEIKQGLEHCKPRWESNHWATCRDECPFRNEHAFCRNVLMSCALSLFYRLEAERDQYKSERDAAVEDMTELMQLAQFCRHCKHLTEDGECTFDFAANKGEPWCWQWRGPEVE